MPQPSRVVFVGPGCRGNAWANSPANFGDKFAKRVIHG
ncbi:hypothetical protein PENARI_c019G03539 [Penicillium arizonense]|uniref:Uncharacterized protein n=1 Tax=Penicillium arizonense TaxID=1835702 RepID=A0A1F5LAB5_PENAI|nr:hypothetical protein PENARI_c019G03539 [Penicillium arizonense]OGE49940.1 hypothetical protein PENARI_c019G03539 [Penicillium arizonense]